jgi:tetratricopeptide (TPR) repeat protein
MKIIIIIYLLSISLKLAAQPDPKSRQQEAYSLLTVIIKEYPNKDSLIWERIKLSDFSRSKSTRTLDRYHDINQLFPYKTSALLLDDLNKLISNDFSIEDYNIAYLKTLRGNLYFHSGEKRKALNDYLSALNYSDSIYTTEYTKQELYISIAAYYYNLDFSLRKDNARQALKHIYLACPEIDLYLSDDCFERQKKELLKHLNEIQKLTIYYQKLIIAEYNQFMKYTSAYGRSNEHYLRTLMRVYELIEFYQQIGNSQKSKNLKKRLLKFLPPDNNGKLYKKFPKNSFYVWMHEYQSNTPFDDWINKNKTEVNLYNQDFPVFIRDITAKE